MSDPSLAGTAADPMVNLAHGDRNPPRMCCAILGPYPADGYQFRDNNDMARCAFTKPCPKHDGKDSDATQSN